MCACCAEKRGERHYEVICAAATIIIAVGFVFSAYGAGSQGFNTSHHVEPNAKIHRAINKLNDARVYLQQSTDDYGGHRSKALHSLDATLLELGRALEYAKRVDRQRQRTTIN